MRRDFLGRGAGRHTDAEINALALQNLCAVSEYVGVKTYLMCAAPTSIDATGYGFLSSVLYAPFVLPIQAEVDEFRNLAAHYERIQKNNFAGI